MASFPDNNTRLSVIFLPFEFSDFPLDEVGQARFWVLSQSLLVNRQGFLFLLQRFIATRQVQHTLFPVGITIPFGHYLIVLGSFGIIPLSLITIPKSIEGQRSKWALQAKGVSRYSLVVFFQAVKAMPNVNPRNLAHIAPTVDG